MKRLLLASCMIAALGVSACKEEQEVAAEPDAKATTAEIAAPVSEDVPPAAPVTTSPSPDVTFPKTVYYQCDDKFVEFTLIDADGKADMKIANASYAMQQAIAASGTKYENLGSPDTYLWSKGDKATLQISADNSTECVETTKPKPPEAPYHAQGNEPGWHFVIEKGVLNLTTNNGETEAAYSVTGDETAGSIRNITATNGAGSLNVTIEDTRCTDDMSGEAFAQTVSVAADGQTLTGCGKSLIRNVTWLLEDINNQGIIDNSHITLTFGGDGSLYGRSGCNNYNGGYSLEGENLSINGSMASTMMACTADALMEQERKFLQTLPAAKKATIDGTGALILSGDDGVRLLFREKTE